MESHSHRLTFFLTFIRNEQLCCVLQGVSVVVSSLMEKENEMSWKQLKESKVNLEYFFQDRFKTRVT